MRKKPTAIVADDDDDVRNVIVGLAKPVVNIVAATHNGETTRKALQKYRPDIAVLDILMPGQNVEQLLMEMRTLRLKTKVLLISGHNREDYFKQWFRESVWGFLYKGDTLISHLVPALEEVGKGRRFSSPTHLNYLHDSVGMSQAPGIPPSITLKECQLLQRIVAGDCDKDIASKLSLSTKTVEKSKARLRKKLQMPNTAALAAFAVRHKLCP